MAPSAVKFEASPRPSASTNHTVPSGGGGFGKFLFLILLLAAAAFAYACYHFNQSPQQTWHQLVDYVEKQIQPPAPAPAPIAKPVPVAPPAPAPVVIQPPAPPPPTNVVTAPKPPPPDPLSWTAAHKDQWPEELSLLVDTNFPIIYQGKVSGSGNVPAGSVVSLVQIDLKNQQVTVACESYGNSTVTLPIQSTDLADRAKEAMAQADANANAATAAKLAAASAPAPQPSPPPAPSPAATQPVAAVTPATNASDISTSPFGVTAGQEPASTAAFVHPGLLHNDDDFRRMKENLNREPWQSGWQRLIANPHASLNWNPRPVAVIVRGQCDKPQNYPLLYRDIAAAYACALRWRISGDTKYADKSVEIMNAWSSTLTEITGSSDSKLAAGIYGFEFANAAEIMRSYAGWKPEDFARFQAMMLNVFYPMNHDFLVNHNGTPIDHYWANWDLCNMCSVIAIGVLCDRRDIYNEAVDYFKHGGGNGAIEHAVYYIHPDGLGQWQESGRDQGHSTMGIGLMGAFCEMAWKQGDDLYSYDNNRFLAGCEYVAKYNLGEDVPYKPFKDVLATQDVISSNSRGNVRPIWELVYNHYVKLKGLPAPYTTREAESVRPEGGGGDYGPNSGGFDQLGYGTLTATLDDKSSAKTAASTTP